MEAVEEGVVLAEWGGEHGPWRWYSGSQVRLEAGITAMLWS
jgi:hypothetical protein